MANDHETAMPRALPKSLRRSDLARATGCNLETIRYYEGAGVLPTPARTSAGHRSYDAGDVRRLRFVLRARELGFSLDDIRGLLGLGDATGPTCAEVKQRTDHHLADVRAKIADLRRIEQVLETTAARCSGAEIPDCPVLDALAGEDLGCRSGLC